MIPDRYEHYRPRHNAHNFIHYAIDIILIAAIIVLSLCVADLVRMDRAHDKALKVLNERLYVEYHYSPPPGWMRK